MMVLVRQKENLKEVFVDEEDFKKINRKIHVIPTNKKKDSWRAVVSLPTERKDKKGFTLYRLEYLHKIIMRPEKGFVVDHINGNSLDNRRENLRVCSRSENSRNSKKHVDGRCKYKGVVRVRNGWVAQCLNGNKRYLGMFKTPEEAALAYDKKVKELFGQFARTNKMLGLLP